MSKKILHTFVVLAYKESEYLEDCICSVLNQKYKSKVVIATSTPNHYITQLASKYQLELFVNEHGGQGIGEDFDFALTCGKTPLITIAHQDDVYDAQYSKKIIENYQKEKKPIIIFPDYYEIRNGLKTSSNRNLKIKRILLMPLKSKILRNKKLIKRLVLSFGDPICCPSVTFVTSEITSNKIFSCDFVCDVDWYAWEKLSKQKGSFVFINELLMGHRVHVNSTTTQIIENKIRTQEDLEMFKKFWPDIIAKVINRLYVKSETSNMIDKR
jgi:Glycosyl transferase family 2.